MPASDGPFTSVWSRPARPERSTLTREQIVTEAIALLDSEGIEALSMRKLAARLNAGATSLYWHVANRDELIQLVIDQIYGEVEIPEDDASDWRAATSQFAHSVRATVRRHPWMVSVLEHFAAPEMGPNVTRMAEAIVTPLVQAGFEVREAERILSSVGAYTVGIAMNEAAWHNWLTRHGQTVEEWLLEKGQQAAKAATDEHPLLRELTAAYEGVDPYQSQDADFEYGLDRLLAGIAARLDTPTPEP